MVIGWLAGINKFKKTFAQDYARSLLITHTHKTHKSARPAAATVWEGRAGRPADFGLQWWRRLVSPSQVQVFILSRTQDLRDSQQVGGGGDGRVLEMDFLRAGRPRRATSARLTSRPIRGRVSSELQGVINGERSDTIATRAVLMAEGTAQTALVCFSPICGPTRDQRTLHGV